MLDFIERNVIFSIKPKYAEKILAERRLLSYAGASREKQSSGQPPSFTLLLRCRVLSPMPGSRTCDAYP